MSKFKKIDLSRIRTIKVEDRQTKSESSRFARPVDPDMTLEELFRSLPSLLKASDLLEFAGKIAAAKSESRGMVWMMGAHPLKVGLSPVIIDLVQNGFITHLAINGAGVIHDLEIAFFGKTSEDVADGLADGSFGMVEETPALIFEAAGQAVRDGLGFGEGIGKFISDQAPSFARYSVIAACYNSDVPVSVHAAIGTDTISQHPGFDGGTIGKLSYDDFLILAESLSGLTGGAVVNLGSAVILPEVFLKALTAARNIYGRIDNFAAANFDMIQHYRPNVNVVTRPVMESGRGYSFTGHHEIMLPILAAAIKYKFNEIEKRS